MHRVAADLFDLVVIDEFAELRRALPEVSAKDPRGGRWNVFAKLKRVVTCAQYLLILSAHNDAPEERLLEELGGGGAQWQMNRDPLLGDLTYHIKMTDSLNHAYTDIKDPVALPRVFSTALWG